MSENASGMPETLTMEQVELLKQRVASNKTGEEKDFNFDFSSLENKATDNPHGIDMDKVLSSLEEENKVPENMSHVSRKMFKVETKDKTLYVPDKGVTYRRSEPKPLSKKARKRLVNKLKK